MPARLYLLSYKIDFFASACIFFLVFYKMSVIIKNCAVTRLEPFERTGRTMTLFLTVSFALLFGLLFTRITNIVKLPDVTAYLVAGVLIGPFVLGRLGVPGLGFTSLEIIEQLGFLSDAALGFIAFAIGSEFRMSHLKKTGKQAMVIGILQALITMICVDIALIALHFVLGDKMPLPAAITLGAIASATAPAATLMVVRQYKAKGKVTDILLPVVALDDAVGLAVFAVSFGIAEAIAGGALDFVSIAVNPVLEIIFSLLLGAVCGVLLSKLEVLFHSNRNRNSMIIGFILATVGLSMLKIHIGSVTIGFSSLLVCMMLGTVFCNKCPLSEELMERADKWSAPLLALFFVISGADLNFSVFGSGTILIIGAVYIAFRCIGKYFGARWSSEMVNSAPEVKKYLGITLFPQAGVALGMCATAASLPAGGDIVRNTILFSVLVYEVVGPMLTKTALTRSGDITEKPESTKNRRSIMLKKSAEKEA